MIDRVNATFTRIDDSVHIDLGRPIRMLNMDYETAFKWARALITMGEAAQRVGAGHARMSRAEVEQFEESVCGTPRVFGSD